MLRNVALTLVALWIYVPLIWTKSNEVTVDIHNNETVDICPCGDACKNRTDGALTCSVHLKTGKPLCIVACCLPDFCGAQCKMPGGHCCSDLKIAQNCDEPIDYSQVKEWDFDPEDFEDFNAQLNQ